MEYEQIENRLLVRIYGIEGDRVFTNKSVLDILISKEGERSYFETFCGEKAKEVLTDNKILQPLVYHI